MLDGRSAACRNKRCGMVSRATLVLLALATAFAREVRGGALLALRLDHTLGDQLADRQREILRARAELLVDLLDAHTGVRADVVDERVRQLVQLVARALRALAARPTTER